MKRFAKRMISIIMAATVAASASAISAFASDYAENIKHGHNNTEVGYDGSAYVTELDLSKANIKPMLTIEQKTVYMSNINETQTVNVSIKDSQRKYNSVGIHFLYDTRLEVVYNEDGQCITYNGRLGFECSNLGDGELFGTNDGSSYGKDGDSVYQITFRLPENAKPGDLFPIGIEYRTHLMTEDCFTNASGNDESKLMQAWFFTKGITNGYIKVVEDVTTTTAATTNTDANTAKAGDINGDGRINPVDASKILMTFAELASGTVEITPEMIAMYDIDGDGKITSVDASLVLAYCANLAEDETLTLEDFIAAMKR